jgi:hypothetical protein
MIVIAALIAGALTGAALAARRGGKTPDILHHAAIYAIAFAVLGVFVSIAIFRMG